MRDPAELLRRLGLEAYLPSADAGHRLWPVRVPEPFLRRIRPGDPDDPLLRQVLPLDAECEHVPGFTADPLGEQALGGPPGLLRKYAGRALVISTGACAIHCRYCFRRDFPYGEASAAGHWKTILHHLRSDPTVRELILSGGDPLSLADAQLGTMVRDLAPIPHLRILRIHTRLPVVIPSRVCPALLEWMAPLPLRVVVVVHINHSREIDPQVARALGELADAGATLLNQSVLLRGVNDSVESLCALSETLLDNGVLPYYLHLLDPARGTAHFHVADSRAKRLHEALRERLPGYLVPRLVREVRGQPYKVAL